jgi:hypothetical protein
MCFEWLNIFANASIVVVDVARLDLEKNMFGVGASIEKGFSNTSH